MSDEVREIAGLLAAHVRLWRDLGVAGVSAARASTPATEAAVPVPTAAVVIPSGDEGIAPPEPGRDRSRDVHAVPASRREAAPVKNLAREGVGPPETAGERSSAAAASSAGTGTQPPALESLEALREWVGDCRRCPLCSGRSHLVFGSGNPAARLVFVGEGPGQDEDLEGLPFVGAAGRLLTDIIEKGMKMPRNDVYICNVVKCRPPRNRTPEPEEIASCSPILGAQLRLVRPEIIIALGRIAAQTLLATDTPITRLRGRWHEWEGIPVMPTFHPAYLLRNPAFKREVWADIQLVLTRLGSAP